MILLYPLRLAGSTNGPTAVRKRHTLLCGLRWSALVHSHAQASVFHSTNWLRALQGVYGYEPVVVTTCPPVELLTNGLVFCRISSWLTGSRLVSLPFSDH